VLSLTLHLRFWAVVCFAVALRPLLSQGRIPCKDTQGRGRVRRPPRACAGRAADVPPTVHALRQLGWAQTSTLRSARCAHPSQKTLHTRSCRSARRACPSGLQISCARSTSGPPQMRPAAPRTQSAPLPGWSTLGWIPRQRRRRRHPSRRAQLGCSTKWCACACTSRRRLLICRPVPLPRPWILWPASPALLWAMSTDMAAHFGPLRRCHQLTAWLEAVVALNATMEAVVLPEQGRSRARGQHRPHSPALLCTGPRSPCALHSSVVSVCM
jgi:hypothetical protein